VNPIVEVAKGGKMALGYPKLFHNGSETFIAWGNAKHVETASLTSLTKSDDPAIKG
jgi:hypothetical protein